jgi:hypothetical protein
VTPTFEEWMARLEAGDYPQDMPPPHIVGMDQLRDYQRKMKEYPSQDHLHLG